MSHSLGSPVCGQAGPQQQPMQVFWIAFLSGMAIGTLKQQRMATLRRQPGGIDVCFPDSGIVLLYLTYPSFGNSSILLQK